MSEKEPRQEVYSRAYRMRAQDIVRTEFMPKKAAADVVSIPFLRVSKRAPRPWYVAVAHIVCAVVVAFIISGIFIAAIGKNPFTYFAVALTANFTDIIYIGTLINATVPLLITALGLSLAYRLKLWNVGGEGQFIVGALAAGAVALLLGDGLPRPFGILVVLAAGIVAGGVWGLLAAVFRIRFGTSETLITLMLNYIALYVISLCRDTKFFGVSGFPAFKPVGASFWLSEVDLGSVVTLDTGLIFAIVLTALMYLFLRFTKKGYELNVLGDSAGTARYAGMKVNRIMLLTMFVSAGIVGLAGALQLTGTEGGHTLTPGITGGVGWTAVIVAWLAKHKPGYIALTAFLITLLECGSNIARSRLGISMAVADIIQGVLLFSILAVDFFLVYKVHFRLPWRKKAEEGLL
ncbi:MAG: ABC transporter permease [Clostridiales bacterium]|jgi:simple sugar transport system permease protein|nr:ABC transporter permease [Clostridiales bacterium]